MATLATAEEDEQATRVSPPAPAALGPLDDRAAEHHGLRQTVINLFTHHSSIKTPSGKPDDPPPGGPRPSNTGVRFLS